MPEDPSRRSARAEGGEIATSTLAEIYAQQGLLGRALTIYRRMLSRTPDDAEIAGRIESLERRIEEAAEDEERAREAPVASADPPEAVETDAAEIPAPWETAEAPAAAAARERLPWDPPEDAGAEPEPEVEPPHPAPQAVRPLDRHAFEAWLAGR